MPDESGRSEQPQESRPPTVTEQAEDAEPRFGGSPIIPSPEVFEQARKNQPAWYRALEQAYEQFVADPERTGVYADPRGRGGTIQQVWLMFTLFRCEMYCLLARPLPAASTERITRLVNCSPSDLIDVLKQIQLAMGSIGVTIAYHDGKTGHCVTVVTYEAKRDRFMYHDPWPARSLLAKENNPAQVDAQPEGTKWSVTAKELERVAFAAFVFPHQWARVQGQDHDLFYETWTKSEFFRFFSLQQLEQRIEAGHTVQVFAPEAFTDTIALLVGYLESGKITRASLRIETRWMIDNFVLAIDLAKSFILCFAPAPDAPTYGKIAEVLWGLRDPRNILKAREANPDESDAIRCVHALMGSVERASVVTDLASLTVETGESDPPNRVLEFHLM
jgi:hypothetical protein